MTLGHVEAIGVFEWGISAVFNVEGMEREMRVLTDWSELSAGAQGVDGKQSEEGGMHEKLAVGMELL